MLKKRHGHIVGEDINKLFLFDGIEPENVIGLLRDCPVVHLKKERLLLSQGDENHSCYFILSGSLRIHLDSPGSPPVSILESGESIGEISLLDGQRASAFVVCQEDCRLLTLKEEVFWSLLNSVPYFSRNLLFLTIKRLRNSNVSISKSIKKQRHYKRTATTDELTGLYNRRWVKNILDRQMKRSRFNGQPLSILMIDADNFKRINDTYGHAAGDLVLMQVARTMANSIRPTDLVARYGGEEFMIILPDTPRSGAMVVAERLRRMVSAGERISTDGGEELPAVTVSIGVVGMASEESMDEFIDRADKALYQAKENGRNRVEG